MRLIDADALDDILQKEYLSASDASEVLTLSGSIIFNAVLDRVRCIAISQPTIDAEPVRHGRWSDDQYRYKCEGCGKWVLLEDGTADMNYCPHCGAKMDGGADNA